MYFFAFNLNRECPQINKRYEVRIMEEEVEPDLVKRGYAYYGEAKIEIIERKLKE